MKSTPKRSVSKVRARRLSDIFSTLERGAPRGFFHISEVLPAVIRQLERDFEQGVRGSQTKRVVES